MSLAAQDRKVSQLAYLSFDLFCLGYLDQARLRSEAAVEEARKLGHPFSLAHALSMAWTVDWATRSREELQARADTLIAVSRGARLSLLSRVGNLSTEDGDWPRAAKPRRGLRCSGPAWPNTARPERWCFCPLLSHCSPMPRARRSSGTEALGHLVEAERLMAETGDRWAEAELHRVRGELLRGDDDTAAERCFLQAIGIAQQQSAKFWELRAAISLARLWREQGKRDAARNLLGPIYGWFTEGFDTPVLKEAKALLKSFEGPKIRGFPDCRILGQLSGAKLPLVREWLSDC